MTSKAIAEDVKVSTKEKISGVVEHDGFEEDGQQDIALNFD